MSSFKITNTHIVMLCIFVLGVVLHTFRTQTQGETFVFTDYNKQIQTYYPIAKIRGCPPKDNMWLKLIHLTSPNFNTFVDIGANKGYFSAKFFELWDYECSKINPKNLYTKIKTLSKEQSMRECGHCMDCRDRTKPLIDTFARICSSKTMNPNEAHTLEKMKGKVCTKDNMCNKIKVYSFEPNMVLSKELMTVAKSFGYNNWVVKQTAFTNSCDKKLYFYGDGELGSILSAESRDKGYEVPCNTVDNLGLDFIDFLKIDTEGHDVSVIRSAKNMIENQRINIIYFEYNQNWPDKYRLQEVVEYFKINKYVCFLEGKTLLIELSPFSWDKDTLEKKVWSNIYCINNKHPVVSIFKQYSINSI